MKFAKDRAYQLLRYLEKYTKTDMVYLAREGSWLVGEKIVTGVAIFLSAVIFANLLPQETFGTYKFVLSIVALLGIISLPGINTAIVNWVARGEKVTRMSFFIRLKWGIIMTIVIFGISTYYYVNGNQTLALALFIAAIFSPIMEALSVYAAKLNGEKKFKKLAVSQSISQTIAFCGLFLTLYLTDSVIIILLSYFLIWTSLNLIFYFLSVTSDDPKKPLNKELVRYGKNITAMNILSTIAAHIDKLLLFHFLGATELAIYIIATAPLEQLRGILQITSPLAQPKLAQRSREEVRGTIFPKILRFVFVAIAMAVAYIVLAPILFSVFFPRYPEAVLLSQVFAISLLAVNNIPRVIFESQQMVKESYIFKIFAGITRVVLIVFLVIPFGVWGVIYARVIAEIIIFLFSLIMIKRLDPIRV
ncbi:MAG TPA: oligosaccharide flippase family protein [Candidatus Paceibacterota bacterium]